jgi:hypothetical protein
VVNKTLTITDISDREQVLEENAQAKFAELHELLMMSRVYPIESFSSEVLHLWAKSRQFSHKPQVVKLLKMPTDKEIRAILDLGIIAGRQCFLQVEDCWLPLLEAPASE